MEAFTVDLYETILCDRTGSWMIYGSHESTLSFFGESLVPLIKEILAPISGKWDIWETKRYNEKLGTLIHTTGPNNIHCFKGDIKDLPEGFVIIMNHGDLEKAPEAFIYKVVEKSQFYMNKSLNLIKETLQRSPEILGLTLEEANQYLNSGVVPVDLPQFVFYEDQEWMLLYQVCDFPIGYSYGMGVNFKGYKAVDIVDLSEGEIIE